VGNTRSEEHNTRILFQFGLVCEYINLGYVRIHVVYRVNQAEYAIRIPAGAPQEYVNAYSPRRVTNQTRECGRTGSRTHEWVEAWGPNHGSKKVTCDEWSGETAPCITGYMCGIDGISVREKQCALYIGVYVWYRLLTAVGKASSTRRPHSRGAQRILAFTRYCHSQYCMLYGIQQEGPGGVRALRNSRAMVLQ